MALNPKEGRTPHIVREAKKLERKRTPSLSREEEPWIRHCVWREYGGIPEGVIPNVREKESVYKPSTDRPIDILSFSSSWDPVDIYDTPDKGEIIGIEAKGKSSFGPTRIKKQLNDFLEPKVLTRLYLAVPATLEERAFDFLESQDTLSNRVGVIIVDKHGSVITAQKAPKLNLKYDGYKKDGENYKIGYGEVRIPNGSDVKNPFNLADYREPHLDDEGKSVKWDYDPLNFEANIISDTEKLQVKQGEKPDDGLMPTDNQYNNTRAYLATGYSAAPYANGMEGKRKPKHGYVRLTIRDFKKDNEKFCLYLHFGGGAWEGGYICFVGKQVDALVKIITSLENIQSGAVPGWGRFIDLEEFRWEYGQNYEFSLRKEYAEDEKPLELHCKSTKEGHGAILNLGKKLTQGAHIKLTKTQRVDLLKTIRIMKYGRPSEIPKGENGYPRIGPNGEDTWDRGTGIEKRTDLE